MAEAVNVSNPVRVVSDSPQRVALDLAFRIDYHSVLDSSKRDKQYWLKLYSECLRVVNGANPDKIGS